MDVCGSANGWNAGVSDVVTCGFALNVAQGLSPSYRGSAARVVAYSPANGLQYAVVCHDARQQSGYSAAYECSVLSARGGAVYLWQ